MNLNSHSGASAAARKRPTQMRSQQTVDRIVDAAARIYSERGYSATTTNHIAQAANVSIGSLYQYFPNKDALLVALEERHLAEVTQVLRATTERWRRTAIGPDAWAADLVETLIAVNDSDLHVLTYDTAPPLPHIEQLTASVVDDLSTEVARLLHGWGVRRGRSLRSRVLVVTALRLVHDLAIRTPPGRRRNDVRREITHLLTSAIPQAQ